MSETAKRWAEARLDDYENALTGVGDVNRDKAMATTFALSQLSGVDCEDRWRGSDLGKRIVETIPREMLRAGYALQVQPSEDDEEDAGRTDAVGALPEVEDDGTAIAEDLEADLERLGADRALLQALCYEVAYGGGAVLIGADDGEADLSKPLDEKRIRRIRHLTPLTGGIDGECVAYRYYTSPTAARWGEPEIWQVRNNGTDADPKGQNTFYVHESRLLVFDGEPVSRRVRRQNKGWGDSVFLRVDRVLAHYGQTWAGVAHLLTDFAQGVLKVPGLAQMLAANDATSTGAVVTRAVALDMSRSIARVMLLDSEEDFKREVTPLAGLAELLREMALRLSAAAEIPLSRLMGQTQGGLGDASKGDQRDFFDAVAGRQKSRLGPQLGRLAKLCFLASEGPTGGVEPKKWVLRWNPLSQPTEKELAEIRKIQAEIDTSYITAGVLSAEEVAASRFGGADYSTNTVLDLEGRKAMAEAEKERAQAAPPLQPGQKPGEVVPGTTETGAPSDETTVGESGSDKPEEGTQ